MSIDHKTLSRINWLSSQIKMIDNDLVKFPDKIVTREESSSVPDGKGGWLLKRRQKKVSEESLTSVTIQVTEAADRGIFSRGRIERTHTISRRYSGLDQRVVQVIMEELRKDRLKLETELESLCPCSVLKS
jgi:hypothetical protein